MHLHAVYIEYYESLPTLLNPLAEGPVCRRNEHSEEHAEKIDKLYQSCAVGRGACRQFSIQAMYRWIRKLQTHRAHSLRCSYAELEQDHSKLLRLQHTGKLAVRRFITRTSHSGAV